MNDDLKTDYGLANCLHELPHLNLSLHDIVHKNFNFSNDQYRQVKFFLTLKYDSFYYLLIQCQSFKNGNRDK